MRKIIFGVLMTVALVCTAVADTATPVARPTPPSYESQTLGVLPGDNESIGLGVNDAGSVVGESNGDGGSRAFYWDPADPGVLHQLTTSDANGIAYAIAGGRPGATAYAVGYEQLPQAPRHAVIWIAPPTAGPITLDGDDSSAHGVNDNGVAVGSRFDVDLQLPIPTIWSPNGIGGYTRTDIALLPNHDRGAAFDINNDGIVVGIGFVKDPSLLRPRAFLRLLNGSVLELFPAQGDINSQAEAVSDVFTDNLGNGLVYVAGWTSGASNPGARGVRWTVNVDTGAVVAPPEVLSLFLATGVNGAGDVAGTSVRSHRAMLWQGGNYVTLQPPKGGRGGESHGLARTASSPTYVVGETQTRMGSRAVVWKVN